MWRAISILLSVLYFFNIASAQTDNKDIISDNIEKITLQPGVTTNLVVKLINTTENDEELSLKVKLPKDWKCFSALNNIHAPTNKTTLKILSVNIPSYTPSGDYSIAVEVINRLGRNVGEMQFHFTIEPKYALNIELISCPEYVFANDTFLVQFMVQNLSNSKAEIATTLRGTDKDEKMSFIINPDSSVLIRRKVIAEKGILKSVQKSISLSASIVSNPEIKVTSSYSYNVIPAGDVKFDTYDRFPVQVSTLFVTDNPGGERLYALMVDVEGKGFLDDENTKVLNFHLRGPDRRGKPLYGIYDEYFIQYSTPKSAYLLGDHTYKLSYLTEFARYGRGAQAEHSFKNFTLGSFITFPRFYPKIKREFATYAAYSASKQLNLKLGYLNKLNNTGDFNHLATISSIVTPFKWTKFDLEYAFGTVGSQYMHAFKTEMNINYRWINLFYNYTMAEKDYPGYFSDTRYTMVYSNFILSKKINIGAQYSENQQNMAIDTLYGNAPFSKSHFFIFNYAFMKNANLSVSYNYQEQKDRMEPMKFNYNEKTMRLGLYKGSRNFGLNFLGEYGKTENLLLLENERLNDMYRGQLSMNYQASSKLNFRGFVNYQQSNRYLVNDYENWVYGGNINGAISKKLNISVNYQSSYNLEESYNDRNILDGRLNYIPNKNNRFEIASRYDLKKNSLDEKQLAFSFRYIHIFNVPVRKKKNIGKLSGRIINKGVNSVAGVVIIIGSDRAISDKDGYYSFPMLPAGNYHLMLDYSKLGVNAITETPAPYLVEILPGIDNKFDIGITTASKITGEIFIEKEVSENDKTFVPIKEQLGKLLIEAKRGDEVFRVFTKDNGKFSFEGLRPGEWVIKAYENGIPKEYELVTGTFKIILSSGQTENVQVKIREVRRRIKFQQAVNTIASISSKPTVQQSDKTNGTKLKTSTFQNNQSIGKAPALSENTESKLIINSVNSNTTSVDQIADLEYRIQIGAYAKPISSTKLLAEKLMITEKIKEDTFNGMYIYTIGSYKTQREAIRKNREFQKNSQISDSFIVSFKDGKRTLKLE